MGGRVWYSAHPTGEMDSISSLDIRHMLIDVLVTLCHWLVYEHEYSLYFQRSFTLILEARHQLSGSAIDHTSRGRRLHDICRCDLVLLLLFALLWWPIFYIYFDQESGSWKRFEWTFCSKSICHVMFVAMVVLYFSVVSCLILNGQHFF